MSTLSVWTNTVDTVIAATKEDAIAVLREHCGYSGSELASMEDFRVVPADKLLTIAEDDGSSTVGTVMTAAQWAEKYGRGFLCSTEY
jgi:hypothetical protein